MYYLILAYGGIDANVNYLMTIRRDGKNSPQLYFQEQETPIPSVANETGEPAAVSPKTEEISSTPLGTINDVAMS